jgi:hypothetical protein
VIRLDTRRTAIYASVTSGHTAREIHSTRIVMRDNGRGPEQSQARHLVKVRPARSNARRDAINESWSATR